MTECRFGITPDYNASHSDRAGASDRSIARWTRKHGFVLGSLGFVSDGTICSRNRISNLLCDDCDDFRCRKIGFVPQFYCSTRDCHFSIDGMRLGLLGLVVAREEISVVSCASHVPGMGRRRPEVGAARRRRAPRCSASYLYLYFVKFDLTIKWELPSRFTSSYRRRCAGKLVDSNARWLGCFFPRGQPGPKPRFFDAAFTTPDGWSHSL